MPEASNATKSRLDKFIRDCEQLQQIYAVEPLTYTDIMGEWWQRINDIIYTLGLTYSGNPNGTGANAATEVNIAWTVPELGKKRSDFFVEPLADFKANGDANPLAAQNSTVAGTGTTLAGSNTKKIKAHKYGLIQSIDKLFQRNVDTWGSLYSYFYNQTHNADGTLKTGAGIGEPADLTEMIFGKRGLADAAITSIFQDACRNLTGDNQGLANSLKHFIEDVIGSNLYDFLDPNKQTPNNASEPSGLIELLFGTDANGNPPSIAELREKWKKLEDNGTSSNGLVGRTNEIVDTIGEDLYDWLNDDEGHRCGFTYGTALNNETNTLSDIIFGTSEPNDWCDIINTLKSGGLLDEIKNLIDYLGPDYDHFVDEKNYEKDKEKQQTDPSYVPNPDNPANPDNPNYTPYEEEQNPLEVLADLKNGQVLYGKIDQTQKNKLTYEGDWILSPGNICENDYEYQQVIKAQNDQEAIFNTFERVSYDSTGGLYNSGTTNSTAVYMLTYPRNITITKNETNPDNVDIVCNISPVPSATENRVPAFTTNSNGIPNFPSYSEQFSVDANGIPSYKSVHDYSATVSAETAAATYGKAGNPFYKKTIYNWIMLPFETKAEMEAYNNFAATASTPLASKNAPFRFAKTCRCRNAYGSDGDRGYFLANKINSSDTQVKIQIPEDGGESLTFTINANFLTSTPRYKNCYCTKAYVSNGMTYGANIYWFEGCNVTYYKSNTEVSTNANDELTKIVVAQKVQTFNWSANATRVVASRNVDGTLLVSQTGSETLQTVYPRNATCSVNNADRTYTVTWKITKCVYVWDFNGYYGSVLTPDNNNYKEWWYYAMPSSDSTMDAFLSNAGISKTSWSYADTPEMTSWNLDKKKNIVDIGTNSITWLGFLSNKKYGKYYFTTMPNSDTNDDDGTGVIIGGYKDYSTGTYTSLAFNHSYNSLALTLFRYRFDNNSTSENIVAWGVNGVSTHALAKDTILASGTYVANGSKLNGTTYSAPTTLTSNLTISDTASYLYSGSTIARNSTLKSGGTFNGIRQNEDAVINKVLYLISSPFANLNGHRGLWTKDDGTVVGNRGFVDTESGAYGLKEADTIKVAGTTYNLTLRYPSTEQRYVDRYITTGPSSRSDADNNKDNLAKIGNIGTVCEAKENGKTGTENGETVKYKFNWCNVSLIVQKLLAAAKEGKFIAVAGNKSNIGLGDEALTNIGGSVLMACPFHLVGESADDWWNSVSANIKTSIYQNINSIYVLSSLSGVAQTMSDDVKYAIFKEKIWPLFELSSYAISSLTLDDILKIVDYTGNYWYTDKTITTNISNAAYYTYVGQVAGWGLLNAYKRRQMNYNVVINREETENASGVGKTYKTTLTYYDAFRNMSGIINNRLLNGSKIAAGSRIAAGSEINGTAYSSTQTLSAELTVGAQHASLAPGSVLKSGTYIAANSVISDTGLSARTLTADTTITKDAYKYLNSHYKYPGLLTIAMTTGSTAGTNGDVPAAIVEVAINGGWGQKIVYTATDKPELYSIFNTMTSYGYTCCSNPLTHFSNNKFIDMDNPDIYVLESDTHYSLNPSTKAYTKIENAGLTDLIFSQYGTGRLISNDTTNKVYFTRGDNNVVQKVVDSVKLGPGLVYGENNVINVDFTNMDKSDIEKMLKQIKVPIWLTGDKRFYVDKDRGSDYLGTDVNNAQYDGHSEERGAKDYPFKTIQACANYVASTFNMYNRTATIVVSPGVYEESLSLGAYSSTTGVIQLEPWDGWWTTTIRYSGAAAVNINTGAKWRLKGFNIESYYGVYQDTSNHYMSCCGTSDAATFDSYANHFKAIGLEGLIIQTLNGKTNVLKAGSIIQAGSYLRKGISFTYKNSSGVNVEYTTTDPVITTASYELALDWTPTNACILLNGSKIKKDSVLCGRDYTADTTLNLTTTEKWHDLRGITVYTNAIMLLPAISLTYNGLWLRSECSDPDNPHVMFHTLSNGCLLAKGSKIAKGSVVNNNSYAADTTLNDNLSITTGSWLMPNSIIARGSIVTKNNYINKEKLEAQRTFETNVTLTNTTHTLLPGSRLAERTYIASGSIINGERYTAAKTLDVGTSIAITTTSLLNGGSILAPDSIVANGSTWNNVSNFTHKASRSNLFFQLVPNTTTYKVLPQWKNNGMVLRRGIFGGSRCIHLEDGGFFRSGASYDLQEYCDFTLDVVSRPTSNNASAGNIEVMGIFAGELAIKGGATYLYQYTPLSANSVDCRRYRVTAGGILRLTHATAGIAGIDCVYNSSNGRMVDTYNEANDTAAIINASDFTPGVNGANTYSKKVNSYKLSYVEASNLAAVMG